MPYWEGWVRNRDVKLHFLTNVPEIVEGAGVPLVIVPGTAEAAEDYADVLDALAPRPCFALSLRGRGQSGSPQRGYTLEDHVLDVEALLDALGLPVCLMGYSRGVTYAIGAAIRRPQQLAGLILGDYPAQHPAVDLSWVDRFMESTCRGEPVTQRMMPHVVEGLQREGEAVDLWPYLPRITCPTLILYGTQPGARLPLEGVERYLQTLPDARVMRFEDSDHRLWWPDFGRYVVTIGGFLERLDLSK